MGLIELKIYLDDLRFNDPLIFSLVLEVGQKVFYYSFEVFFKVIVAFQYCPL